MNKKYSDKTKEKVIEQYLAGVSVSDLVSKFNVSRTTVYTWTRDHKKNHEAVDRCKKDLVIRTVTVRITRSFHLAPRTGLEPVTRAYRIAVSCVAFRIRPKSSKLRVCGSGHINNEMSRLYLYRISQSSLRNIPSECSCSRAELEVHSSPRHGACFRTQAFGENLLCFAQTLNKDQRFPD